MDDECQVHLRPERVGPVLEGGDHAEVPATALQGPQQLWVVLLVCGDEVAVRGHEVGGDQVVAPEPMPATQPAQPTAQVSPAIPVAVTAPIGTARPNAWVSWSSSPIVTPP